MIHSNFVKCYWIRWKKLQKNEKKNYISKNSKVKTKIQKIQKQSYEVAFKNVEIKLAGYARFARTFNISSMRFVIFPNFGSSKSNFSPAMMDQRALIIDIFIILLSCTGWFTLLLKCRINLETSSERISSMLVLPKPKSRKCLKVNLLWSFQYRPWLKITPGFRPSNSGDSQPRRHSLKGRIGGRADNSSFWKIQKKNWEMTHCGIFFFLFSHFCSGLNFPPNFFHFLKRFDFFFFED